MNIMKILPQVPSNIHQSYAPPVKNEGSTPGVTGEEGQKDTSRAQEDQASSKRDIYSQGASTPNDLTSQELQELFRLKKRDQEVKQHEMAHIAAGGPYVRGGAHFEYKTGPDGRRYAVAGEVSIDTSEEKDPRATLEKMRTVQRAALAPAHPSQQDRRVAAQAAAKAIQAMVEIMKEAEENKVRQGANQPGERGTGENRGLDIVV